MKQHKQIVVIAKINNEEDIIESFCRYYLLFCDAIIIYDNQCVDNTRAILYQLIQEGLPIHIADECILDEKDPIAIFNHMASFAISKFGADIMLAIDADEFLFDLNGGNPREPLEQLDETKVYLFDWRNYVCTEELIDNTVFLPSYFPKYREDGDAVPFQKTILSRYLFENGFQRFMPGKHDMLFTKESAPGMERLRHRTLLMAHFPIRSVSHLARKVIPNWVHHLCMEHRGGRGYHLQEIYNQIKKDSNVSKELVEKASLEYALKDTQKGQSLHTSIAPLNAYFGGKILLKYTDYLAAKKNTVRILLAQIEQELVLVPQWRQKAQKYDQQQVTGLSKYPLTDEHGCPLKTKIGIDSPSAQSEISKVEANKLLHVYGWVLDAYEIQRIKILIDDRVSADADYGDFRPDVSNVFPEYAMDYSGFHCDINIADLNPGAHSICCVLYRHNAGVSRSDPQSFYVT